MTAIGTEQGGRERKRCRGHTCGPHIKAINLDQVVGHPQRQRDETPENEKVIEGEPPDLKVPERLKLLRKAWGLDTGFPPRDQFGIILGKQEEHERHDRKADRPDMGHALPSIGHHDEGRDELRDRRADVARAKYPQGRPLMARIVEARDIGNANDEGPASQANAKRCDKIHGVGRGEGQRPGCHCGQQHLRSKDQTASVFLGPHPKKQARDRTGQDGCCNEKAELRFIETKLGFDPHTNNRKNRPHRKAGRKGNGAEPESSGLIGFSDGTGPVHNMSTLRLCIRNTHFGLVARGAGCQALDP